LQVFKAFDVHEFVHAEIVKKGTNGVV